ncbi:MAG: hydantoinase B/oxoprolinase family protein [Vicinamibacteria bacterium]
MSGGIDPISTEVIRNAFNAIAEDMSAVLGRSAFSPVIYESHDYGVALFNERVETLGQAPGHPFFIGGLDSGVKAVVDKYGMEDLAQGDVFTVNDSYITGGHLNDVDVISVLTYEGSVVGFAAIRAHWLDVGMAEPGFPVNTTEIFQEGVRWGPTQIMSEGEWVRDVLDILLLNSRAPRTLKGDLNAQVAAARMGERRYRDLIDRFGLEVVRGCTRKIFDATEKKYRDFIASIEDGVYEAEGYADDDFITPDPIRVKVKVTVAGDEMTIDTTGSAPQCKGNVNCGFPNTVSAARLALAFLFPSDRPEVNHGSFLPLRVVAEPGSVFAAREPAACMHPHPGMLMVDLVIRALAPVLPRNVAAGLPGDSWNVILMGKKPGSGEFFVSGEALDGGWGASVAEDGESALIHSAAGDFRNVPVETLEGRFPVRVKSFRLGRDSGGPGKFRGGLNVVKEYEVETDCRLTLHFDRALTPQWGLFGGGEGARPRVTIYPADGSAPREILKIEQMPLKKGDRFVCETGGGGGYGRSRDRAPERVRLDVLDGYVSREAAVKQYGWVADP